MSIHANAMGDFVGQHQAKRLVKNRCPICGGPKNQKAVTCIACRPVKEVKRSKAAMDNHHRVNAAIGAGWKEEEVLCALPASLPTWEEIAERCPEAVLKWHPEMIVKKWWNESS